MSGKGLLTMDDYTCIVCNSWDDDLVNNFCEYCRLENK